MNSASEIAIRWYIEEQGMPEDVAEDLIETLYAGCGNGEEDSIELRDRILAVAAQTEKDEPWKSIVDLAITLHVEMDGVDKAIHNLGQLEQISAAVDAMPANPLARKITIKKIKECVGRLRA